MKDTLCSANGVKLIPSFNEERFSSQFLEWKKVQSELHTQENKLECVKNGKRETIVKVREN